MSHISLHEPIQEICERLGLNPDYVVRLDIRPNNAKAELLIRNENGKPYVDPATGDAATETLDFETTS